MSKVKIKLLTIGHMPLNFSTAKIKKWKSSTFEIVEDFDSFTLNCDSDGYNWEFSDRLVKEQLPMNFNGDFMIAIVNVPIENNWYSRRLGNNQVVFTFNEIKEILEHSNIPLENVIYRILYAYTLLYRRAGDKIPDFGEVTGYTHDETRGCLFDMNGIKTDLIASCHKPIICNECQVKLSNERVSKSYIDSSKKEIKRIRKDLYFRILGWVKKHPVLALVLSSLLAISLGVTSSLIASCILSFVKTL
ncbi:hypothetical protein [Pseudoalteromonas aurantia]|uniref:Uncharacterized protein n=1 Tax=Pseudoalteromonas aurantia 208 TaxID=1314867 RepID=A0ABR9EB92_9GAMM|nr:hypothetical protein [Pseudoalteromonas aurantia]MBE0368265.1 hypothetical protein [Pseudoalteromonas aurantia 208]